MVDSKQLSNMYATNFALAFSPDGKYVATANNYGSVFLFSFPKVSAANLDTKLSKFTFSFQATDCPIYSLLTKDQFLLCATAEGTILGYLWEDLRKQKVKLSFTINTCQLDRKSFEVNALLDASTDTTTLPSIYSAGGDNRIHLWDLETRKITTTFNGHTDYVHCLSAKDANSFLSGGEDGFVMMWDVRTGCKPIKVLEPYKSTECGSQNTRGRWIGAVATMGDWMVCGGGPNLSLWHLGSFSLAQVLETSDVDHHAVVFHDDKIIGGGGINILKHWNLKGELLSIIPVEAPVLYDIQFNFNSEKYKVLCACGDGPIIDVFLNLGYTSFLLDTSV